MLKNKNVKSNDWSSTSGPHSVEEREREKFFSRAEWGKKCLLFQLHPSSYNRVRGLPMQQHKPSTITLKKLKRLGIGL